MPTTRLSRLEGVNRVLRKGLGALPVSSLEGPLPAEAVAARDKLDDVHRDVLDEGLDLNTDREVDVEPDADGFVHVPQDALRVWYSEEHRLVTNLVPRGGRVYNTTELTFVFASTVTLDMVRYLDFDTLEHHVQRYIVARAARELQAELVGNESRVRTLLVDERLARNTMDHAQGESARYSLFDTGAAATMVRRNRPDIR